jgi:hypothetical protein
MSMEDILKVLVNSRQQGNSPQQTADPMADLIGSLLGGGQAPAQSQAPMNQNAGGTDLSGMMGLLETFMGGAQSNNSTSNNSPIMMLISPFVPALAKKANVSPEIAMVVISFVVHKLLAHHPTSGRDSNSFNFEDMLGQMSSGKVDTSLLRQSGMVNELSKKTGLDDAATEQVLQLAFATVGKTVGGMVSKGGSAKPASAGSAPKKSAGRTLGNTGAKRGKKA